MNLSTSSRPRCGALLAINLLFLMIWGFAGIGKVVHGMPAWFPDKFGETILARVPGLAAAFWLLAASEMLAFTLSFLALIRGEFLISKSPTLLTWMLVWSLFIFVQLGFGQWLTNDFNAAFQLFAYFGVTLIAFQFVSGATISVASTDSPAAK